MWSACMKVTRELKKFDYFRSRIPFLVFFFFKSSQNNHLICKLLYRIYRRENWNSGEVNQLLQVIQLLNERNGVWTKFCPTKCCLRIILLPWKACFKNGPYKYFWCKESKKSQNDWIRGVGEVYLDWRGMS